MSEPIAPYGVRIDVCWLLKNVSAPQDQWQLAFKYIPASEALQRIFTRGANEQNIAFPTYPGLTGETLALVEEVKRRVPPPPVFRDGRIVIEPQGQLAHIVRYPGRWGTTSHLSPEDIIWSRPYKIGDRDGDETKGRIPISELMQASVAAIRQLDGYAIDLAHRGFQAELDAALNIPAEERIPAQRIKLFIAYRRTAVATAERVHQLLSEFPHLFELFLDRHNLTLGKWKPQLFENISDVDIFLPIVTSDYGESGSFSLTELEEARRVAEKRGLTDFFAPIFFDRDSEVAKQLLEYQGMMASKVDDLVDPEWGRFVRQVIGAGVRNLP